MTDQTEPQSMVERVTLAVFKCSFHPDDAANAELVAAKRAEWTEDWRRAERCARAAIAAMREPTEGMGLTGSPMMAWKALGGGALDGRAHASEVYRAMIDAALAEDT